MDNLFPQGAPVIRLGYSGFISAVIMLWRMHRNARQLDIKAKAEIIVPLRWFK